MPIVTPAVGDTGTAAWADSVANFANAIQSLTFIPGGNLDTPAAGTATWMTLGNVTVPTWANTAVVIWSLASYSTGSTAALSVTAGIKVGSAAGPTSSLPSAPGTANVGMSPVYVDTLTGLSSGTQSVTVSATFVSGTGTFRVDTNDRITALIIFLP